MVTREATKEQMQEEVKVKKAPAVEEAVAPSIEEARASIEARIRSMQDEIEARLPELQQAGQIEFAELIPWWDLFVIGPLQAPPFAQPSNVISLGEPALVATIVVVNPLNILPGPTSPLVIMAGANAEAEIKYRTGNLDTWTSTDPNIDSVVPITGVFNFDIQAFTPSTVGVRDLSVSARITTPGPGTWPFGGHASLLFNFDSEPVLSLFGFPAATPGFTNRIPLRFSVYQPA